MQVRRLRRKVLSPLPRQPGWGLVFAAGLCAALALLWLRWPQTARSPQGKAARPTAEPGKPRAIFSQGPFGAKGSGAGPSASPGWLEPSHEEEERPAQEVISGRVLGPDGAPVAGALVALGGAVESTGPDGKFRLPRAMGRLRASHPQYFPREVEADRVETLSLVLVPGVRVKGQITGPEGLPLAGATVAFGTSEQPATTTTDAEGRYESPLLQQGLVALVVSHARHQPTSKVLFLRAPTETWSPKLEAGEPLEILALDPSGEPLSDAEAWLGAPGTSESTREWKFLGRTGDLGQLLTRRTPGVPGTLRLRLAGFRDEQAPVPPAGQRLELRLKPVPALRGQAIDAGTGLPVAITSVRLEMQESETFVETPHRGLLFQSLELGKLVVGLPPLPGTYRVHVSSQGREDRTFNLQGESDPVQFDGTSQPAPLVLRLAERLELLGRVASPTGELDRLRIELLSDAPPEGILGALDDGPERSWEIAGVKVPAPYRPVESHPLEAQGKFRFAGLSHGTYRLRVVAPRGSSLAEYLSAPFAIPWEGEFPVELRRGARLEGRVLDATGRPRPDVPVILIQEDSWARVVTSDAEGRYEMTSLPPGKGYRLVLGRASPGDPRGPERRIDIEEGGTVTYDLRPAASESTPAAEDGVPQDGTAPLVDASTPARTAPPGPTAGAGAPDERAPPTVKNGLGSGSQPPPAAVPGTAGEDENGAPIEAAAAESAEGLVPGTAPLDEPGGPDGETGTGNKSAQPPGTSGDPASGPGVAAREEAPEPTPGETRPTEPGAQDDSLSGRLEVELLKEDGSGAYDGEVEVEVDPEVGDRYWRGVTRGGQLHFGALPRGRHHLRVRVAGLLLAERATELGELRRESFRLGEPEPVAVRLRLSDGSGFHGRALVSLSSGGHEVFRRTLLIDELLTVPTPGPGEYELSVVSDELESHLKVRVGATSGAPEPRESRGR